MCDVGQGNLAISKLLAKKNCTFFAIYIVQDVLLYSFGWWCVGWRNFFSSCDVVSIFVLAGNRFWFYILLMYLE